MIKYLRGVHKFGWFGCGLVLASWIHCATYYAAAGILTDTVPIAVLLVGVVLLILNITLCRDKRYRVQDEDPREPL